MNFFFFLYISQPMWYSVMPQDYEDMSQQKHEQRMSIKFVESDERPVLTPNNDWREANSTYDFGIVNIEGKHWHIQNLFFSHPMVIINVPSNFRSVRHKLQELNDWESKYKFTHYFRVLVFPCDQFSKEQNWTNKQIERFALENLYKFFIFQKTDVNGPNAHPLYLYLQSLDIGPDGEKGVINSDFTTFIINRRGVPIVRMNSSASVEDIQRTMEEHKLWINIMSRIFPRMSDVNFYEEKFDSLIFYALPPMPTFSYFTKY